MLITMYGGVQPSEPVTPMKPSPSYWTGAPFWRNVPIVKEQLDGGSDSGHCQEAVGESWITTSRYLESGAEPRN